MALKERQYGLHLRHIGSLVFLVAAPVGLDAPTKRPRDVLVRIFFRQVGVHQKADALLPLLLLLWGQLSAAAAAAGGWPISHGRACCRGLRFC